LLNSDEQTAGRGSGIRKWVSQKGNALTTLMFIEKDLPKDIMKLSLFIMAITICEN
jgi:biotin-(acetyl-CoA carboxylase) ligase